jgi:hypothetical protein
MEHIRQCSKEHAPSPFDIAEDIAGLGSVAYLGAIFVFPFLDESEKLLPLCMGVNPGHSEEYVPKLPSIGGLGEVAAPHQSLPLDVDQTALHSNAAPEAPEHVGYVRVAINGEATGAQAEINQPLEEYPELRPQAFRDAVLTSDQHMGLRIHQGNKTTRAMNEGPIQNEVVAFTQAQNGPRRRLLKAAVDHAVKLPRAMPALIGQLPDRIAFNDPTPEPLLLVDLPGLSITPTEGLPALNAKPPLFTVGIMPISLDGAGAVRAVFF